ncbi:MAG: HAD-IB family phosphatase [Thermoplasmata archaeon]
MTSSSVATGRAAAGWQVLLDFDGTLADSNVAIDLITAFVPDGAQVARRVDDDLRAGRITLRQAWEEEAGLLRADRLSEMAAFVRENVRLRAGSHELLALLGRYSVPTAIVSGGLQFYIDVLLERERLTMPILADVHHERPDGRLAVEHPHGHPSCRLCGICKALAVRRSAEGGRRTIFIGDGSTDRYAAEVADIVFARRRLQGICRELGIRFFPFEDFFPVVDQLERWFSGAEAAPPVRAPGRNGSECPISIELYGGSPGTQPSS